MKNFDLYYFNLHPILKNSLLTSGILLVTSIFCFLLQQFVTADAYVPLIFILAIVLISRFTEGYSYGIVASFIAVFGVNCIFTFPYFSLNFSLTGYPLTFFVMLTVSIMISALTTQIKQQEQIKLEVEREHMKSSMLRSISHDFRTPLTGIMGDCAILLDSEQMEDAVSRQLVQDVMEQSMWLMKMMENILSMTKIESGQTFIHKRQEVVDDVINEASGHVIGLKDRRHYRVDLPEEVIVAEMDGKMIAQVIINILDNAVKHTQDGGKIRLKVKHRNLRVYFIIEDDGDGVPEELQNRIFDEFVSVSDKSADQKRGIGLGLAICKAVLTAHGGEIWEENREEGGARFVFWIPAKRVEEDGKEKDINCGR